MMVATLRCPNCDAGVEPLPDGSVICPSCDWFGETGDALDG
jgi:uncharacterized Zn finger protein (UPF0148 family)